MNRRKRIIGISLLLLVVLIGMPVWIVYRAKHQARLDHALIESIKAGDNQKTLALLAEGANGEARENEKPPTLKEIWVHLREQFRHRAPSSSVQLYDNQHLPALLLVYHAPRITRREPDPKVILALLDQGANVNDRDEQGFSPLHHAMFPSSEDTVRLLLMRGANIEAKDNNGETALHLANAGKMKILLEHGANIEARESDGRTPLFAAAGSYPTDMERARFLLEHGAKVSQKNKSGRTALDCAVWMFNAGDTIYYPECRRNVTKIIALLAKASAKNQNWTALDSALQSLNSAEAMYNPKSGLPTPAYRNKVKNLITLLHQYGVK